ncbi:MAG: polysaccharide biosynthesis/export family protein [Planctomycetota bacterium]|nr:polysaccharide biosynthesis/export family protein [Planctomycetota bacterium]
MTELTAADSQQTILPEATEPTEADLIYLDSDYVIGPEDVLDLSIMDLYEEGRETALRRTVTPNGLLSIPEFPRQIRAEGLTAPQLEQAIKAAYVKSEILRNPTVQVTVFAQRSATYTVITSAQGGGRYTISQKDMTLMDALAPVGGLSSNATVPYIYVYRGAGPVREHAEGEPAEEAPAPESAMSRATKAGPEPVGPLVPGDGLAVPGLASPEAPGNGVAVPGIGPSGSSATRDVFNVAVPGVGGNGSTSAPATLPDKKSIMDVVAPGATSLPAPTETGRFADLKPGPASSGAESRSPGRWEFRDGQWVQVAAGEEAGVSSAPSRPAPRDGAPKTAAGGTAGKDKDPFDWGETDKTTKRRVIAIHVKRLLDNDRKMNIVIRNKDIIRIPEMVNGEFYVAGEVARPGVYSLTGRQITMKMALTAAGNLQGLPEPKNAVLYRRLEGNQELIMPVNVESIFRGEEPDVYLRPDDIIAVGTSPRAYWLSIVRYAFRLSYGFGFVYDRNFAPTNITDGHRFDRW